MRADPRNYGKAAKRMYNIFRLNGSYEEAAYLRELFDEPTAVLYQVGAVVRTLDEASQPGSGITRETLLAQLDALILDVVKTLEGDQEVEVVRELAAPCVPPSPRAASSTPSRLPSRQPGRS